jgi:hypothetical protein
VSLPANIRRSALVEGDYRYWLVRQWDDNKPWLVIIMLNPSWADASQEDPTLLRCIHFANLWGFGRIEIVNAFALRSPKPKALLTAADPIGPRNDLAISLALARTTGFAVEYIKGVEKRVRVPDVLLAWGCPPSKALYERIWTVEAMCRQAKKLTVCLGRTQAGWPKHPLARGVHRVPNNQKPLFYDGFARSA